MRRIHGAAPPANQDPKDALSPNEQGGNGSVLGLVPHQLRGFLAQFRNMHIVGAAYNRCTGCSETVSPHDGSDCDTHFSFRFYERMKRKDLI